MSRPMTWGAAAILFSVAWSALLEGAIEMLPHPPTYVGLPIFVGWLSVGAVIVAILIKRAIDGDRA